ncbi:LicD family-domain-containing protein [Clohesyomyces aquaticus]|uniref:LicD family-domain-containing protein n=1 Tax=Clohesyomyces aquaticus TaxID=1231657 RepID=A0A1Y1ZFB1_9PLEO|nr:LicD family-domain-containing protein [Clohesyomyces aquaticus]
MVFLQPVVIALALFSFLSEALPALQPRDADFASLRGLTTVSRDRSGKKGDPVDKYFHESTFHPHYDGRFAQRVVSYDTRRTHLTHLMQTYLKTMHGIRAETWIMHGSLLGWWWNRKIMPWDSDVDVQISEQSMTFLADFYNMTVHHYDLPGVKGGRNYLLEVNPHYKNGSTDDRLNVIDARWIDTETGLFIDITTLRRNETAEALGLKGHMMCKDKHHYLHKDIFPLRDSVFESMPVKIPFAYSQLLEEEYGPRALTRTEFEHHHFDTKKMEWVLMDTNEKNLIIDERPFRGAKPHRLGPGGSGGGGTSINLRDPDTEVMHVPGSALEIS